MATTRSRFNRAPANIVNAVFCVTDPEYGAVGDGATNDLAAINIAVTALNAAGGGTLLFPAVNTFFNITGGSIALGSNTRVAAIGKVKQSTAATPVFTANAKSHIIFDGCTIQGASAAAGLLARDAGAYGISLTSCTDVSINSSSFLQTGDAPIFCAGCLDVRISSCRIFHCFHGVYLRGTVDACVDGCSITDTNADATAISYPMRLDTASGHAFGQCTDVELTRNRVDGYPNGQVILMQSGARVTVQGNIATSACDGYGLGLSIAGDTGADIIISDNIFVGVNASSATDGGNSGIVVHGNPVGPVYATNVIIEGNIIRNANAVLKDSVQGGIGRTEYVKRMTIRDNSIDGCYGSGVVLGINCQDVDVSGNVITNVQAATDTTKCGILFYTTGAIGNICDNVINTCTRGIQLTDAGALVNIFGNKVSNAATAKYTGASIAANALELPGHLEVGIGAGITGAGGVSSTGDVRCGNNTVCLAANRADGAANLNLVATNGTNQVIAGSTQNGNVFLYCASGTQIALSPGTVDNIIAARTGGGVLQCALYGGTPRNQPSITGALSAVIDPNAKTVLTSIIASLTGTSGINSATDATT